MAKEKLVIINGDDFGYYPGSNEGIKKAYREGILTSTTAMANCLKGDERLDGLQSRISKPPLGIGVHLNLTYGKPILPEFFGDRNFTRPLRGMDPEREWLNSTWQEYFGKFNGSDIEMEFMSQIWRARTILGKIDHLDSHHGVDAYVGNAYLNVAKGFNLPVRPSSPLSEVSIYGGDFQEDPTFFDRAKKAGVKSVTRLVMQYFYQSDNPKAAFFESLESVQPGEVVEYMFHPAIDDQQGAWRVQDLRLITDPEVIAKIKDLGITLTTYACSTK